MTGVAAAVVHYGRPEPTLRCLHALAAMPEIDGIHVVDNSGTGPPDELDGVGTSIDWRTSAENLGYGRSLNRVARKLLTDGGGPPLLLCCNNDALPQAGMVARLVAALEADGNRAAAVPRILRVAEGTPLWYGGGDIDWLRGTARVEGVGGPGDAPAALEGRDVGFASGCILLLRLAALAEVGGFDERYFLYEEDVELSIRLRRHGMTLRYVPDAVAHHLGQGAQRGTSEPFVPIHRLGHPRAARLTELRVAHRLLTMERHASRARRLAFHAWFPLHWGARALAASAAGRPGVAVAVWRGVQRYRRLRGTPSAGLGKDGTERGEARWSPS